MASSTGIAADSMPMPAPGSPVVDDGGHGERPAAARPPDDGNGTRARGGVLTSPTSWRVRTKLIAILAIPVVAIIVNALIDASSVLTSTRDINRVSSLVTINQAAVKLTYELERERTFTVDYVALQLSPRKSTTASLESIKTIRGTVDSDFKAYQDVAEGKRGTFGDQVNEALDAVALHMDDLKTKRDVLIKMTEPVSVMQAYDAIIEPLLDLVAVIPQGNDDRELDSSVEATSHLVLATDLLAQQQSQIEIYLASQQPFSSDDFRAALTLDSQRSTELDQFAKIATPEQLALYATTVNQRTNRDVVKTQQYTALVLNALPDRPLTGDQGTLTGVNGIDPTKWLQNTRATIELNYDVVDKLLSQIDKRVDSLRGDIQRRALLSALFTVLILAAALVITLVVAQSLIRPLFALRTAALDIAERRLPEAVRRIRDSSEQVIDDEIETVGIDTDEEIGEVARAFDQVHHEAVKLASEQAVLRNNVNAMFVNLSRRSQGLVERQLRLIDDLENREQDPDQLSNLFKLDHLATRMRRNNESLLVLAGTDTARRWTHPVPLNEVVLAAISEVEQYTRVKQTTAASVSIAGNGVSDVVHLIAELLENATAYSPPATDVVVTSHSLGPGAGAMIEIVDQGIGMPAKDLERINERLANPPVVDVSVSRTMGLFAVGRLASRHGIRVQLRESPTRGITAVIRLPAKLVTGDGAGGTSPAGAARPAAIGRPGGEAPARPVQAFGAFGPGQGGRPELGSGPIPGALTGPSRQPSFSGPQQYGPPSGAEGGRGGPRQRPDDLLEEMTDQNQNRFGPPSGPLPALTSRQTPQPGPADHPGPGTTQDAGRFGPPPLAIGPAGGQREGTPPAPMTGPLPTRETVSRYTEQDTQRLGPSPFSGGQPVARSGQQPGPDGPAYAEPAGGPRTGQPDTRGPRDDWSGDFQRPDGPEPLDQTGPMPRQGGYAPNGAGSYRAPGQPGQNYAEPPNYADTRNYAGQPDYSGPQENVFARPAHRPEPAPVDVPQPSWDEQPATGGYPRPQADDTGEIYLGDGEDLDTTPIFDSVSAWFQRRSPSDEPRAAAAPDPVVAAAPDPVVEVTPPAAFTAPRASAGMRIMGSGAGGSTAEHPVQRQEAAPAAMPVRPAAAVRTPAPGPGPDAGYRQPAAYGDNVSNGSATGPRPVQAPVEPLPKRGGGADNGWESAGDAGWRAAEALREPGGQDSSTTRAGLPVRVPMSNLVPGTAEPASNRKPQQPRPADATTRSPEAVGGRLASFYQGVRQGRDMGAETRSARRDGQEER
ncbi:MULTISPECIES: nitrate- and nitrite sensing domain-containing protein [unclassified Pseudofrankia]|uniref:nitrate- and nitrite sensing domain-containing protein n=1 Tax=unclassified Pseudofrankia TaxID=2994372 RepID=UPI0008D97B86|nr:MULTISPECIES: nitrate- and nitrite sensing domain-containing protein [unclassified Pseudofrankia]MDT3438502.1 nitrate- and nitrite sensing domain-containing protein [Pseudofrankia sp. BMG5.37]OHV49716.1 histidine kinase [Pseudofrankia sp. BMG5.36]